MTLLGLDHLEKIILFIDSLANIKRVKIVIGKEDRSLNIKVLERYFMCNEMKTMTAKFRSSLPSSFELDF